MSRDRQCFTRVGEKQKKEKLEERAPEVNFDEKILVGKHLQVISVRLISNWIATKQNATIKYQVTRAIGPLRPHTHRARGRTYSL